MRYPIFASMLAREYSPEMLAPNEAWELQRVDIDDEPGAVKRGAGVTRVNFTTGVASDVMACGLGKRRDGVFVLLYQASGGDVEAVANPGPNWLDDDY